ncbi:MAG: hypothetical protein ACYST6_09155 [Planctomycetota bacterium]|jgi:hypothetical protein
MRRRIAKLAKWYVGRPGARFVVAIPWVGSAIHEYLTAQARAGDLGLFRRLWGLANEAVYVVCSELDRSKKRQQPEPGEFLYLGKYGDLDALFEVLVSLNRLFPNLSPKFCTGDEFENLTGNPYAENLILIGGPDYNKVVRELMDLTPFEFEEREGDTVLVDKRTKESYESKRNAEGRIVTDYGFFLKMQNPHNADKKVVMLNGIHTYGVYGAAKCFLSQDEHEVGIAPANCAAVLDRFGDDPTFAVVLEVRTMGNKVGTPRVEKTRLMPI